MRSLCFTSQAASSPTGGSTSAVVPSTPRRRLSLIDQIIETAHSTIAKWNPESSSYASVTSLFYENRREAKQFLRCVADLQKAMHLMLPLSSDGDLDIDGSDRIIRAQGLMQMAAKRLEKEFYQILSTNRAHLDPESVSARSSRLSRSSTSDFDCDDETDDDVRVAGDSISEVEDASSSAMADLRSIADCMISAGYGKECVRIYKIVRKSIVDEGIYRLGVEKTARIHRMDWRVLELKIQTWLDAVKIAVNTLFTGERILCDHVFANSDSIRESCFADVTKDGAAVLIGFPELVAKSNQSPDRVFRLLDLYGSISNLWPEIESIFSFESTVPVRSQAFSSLVALSEAVYKMLANFESTLQKDSSKSPVPGGGVHPLTLHAMNYLSLLADYGVVLTDMVADWPSTPNSQLRESYLDVPNSSDSSDSGDSGEAPSTAVSLRLAWLILVLVCKLDGKAKHFKDVAVSYLFLVNNLHYIVSSVRTSNLRHILGGDWIAAHEEKVKQFAGSYERLGWCHVASTLPAGDPAAAISTDKAKECFRRFNTEFEHAYRKQSSCVVPDPDLRDEIKGSVMAKIAPAYREFYGAQRQALGCRRNVECLVRYTPEDVENYLSDLFHDRTDDEVEDDWTSRSSTSSLSSSLNLGHLRPHRGGVSRVRNFHDSSCMT